MKPTVNTDFNMVSSKSEVDVLAEDSSVLMKSLK